jgi:hypothetical protein
MSEKKKKGKRAEEAKSVMGNLPSTRPTRMSRHRDANGDGDAASAAAKPSAPAKPTPAAPAKPKPAAKRKTGGPRAVRSGSPSLETSAPKTPPPKPRESRPPKGAELLTTAVQATGELAQIGVKLGVRAAKRAVERLPKP